VHIRLHHLLPLIYHLTALICCLDFLSNSIRWIVILRHHRPRSSFIVIVPNPPPSGNSCLPACLLPMGFSLAVEEISGWSSSSIRRCRHKQILGRHRDQDRGVSLMKLPRSVKGQSLDLRMGDSRGNDDGRYGLRRVYTYGTKHPG
jgi:hypothetical protein